MPEEITTAGGEQSTTNGEAAVAVGEQNTVTKAEGSEEGATGKEGEGADPKIPEPKVEDNDEPQIQSRKTAKDFIIQRQQKKIEKLEAKDEGKEGSDSEEEDPIDPEDKKVIERVLREQGATMIEEALEPILSKQVAQEDENELQTFLNDPGNVDFKPYESTVRKYMAHPSRRLLPIKSIFYEVAGDDLIKIGAERERRAREDAAETNAGGGSVRGEDGGKVNWEDLTPEEFRIEKAKALDKNRS